MIIKLHYVCNNYVTLLDERVYIQSVTLVPNCATLQSKARNVQVALLIAFLEKDGCVAGQLASNAKWFCLSRRSCYSLPAPVVSPRR